MMVAYTTIFVPITTIGYLIFVRNDEIPIVPTENGFLYNKIRTKLVGTLKGNHSSGFKTILVNFGAKKSMV
jgi:hypothetical protein